MEGSLNEGGPSDSARGDVAKLQVGNPYRGNSSNKYGHARYALERCKVDGLAAPQT